MDQIELKIGDSIKIKLKDETTLYGSIDMIYTDALLIDDCISGDIFKINCEEIEYIKIYK